MRTRNTRTGSAPPQRLEGEEDAASQPNEEDMPDVGEPQPDPDVDTDSASDVEEEELEHLRAIVRKQERKAERDRLRTLIAGGSPAAAAGQDAENPLTIRQKRPGSNGDGQSNFPLAKHLRPAAPDVYTGRGGAQALTRFLTALELYFDALLIPESEHTVRVRNAASFLRKDAAEAYIREKGRITTFDEFKAYLKGTINDPTSRLAAAIAKLHSMKQEDKQNARKLLLAIEAVEQDIPSDMTPEVRKAWHFLCSLNPHLRNAVLGDIKEVKSRDQVLTAAQWQEDLYQQRREAREPPAGTRRAGGGSDEKQKSAVHPGSRYPTKKISSTEVRERKVFSKERNMLHKERKESGACFKCGSHEHRANFHDAGNAQGRSTGSAPGSKN